MPEIDSDHVRLQSEPTETSVEAASKAIGKSGSWREQVFHKIAFAPQGLTVIEIEISLAHDYPCLDCGCTHRSPKTQNEINTRLGELRDWGWIQWARTPEGGFMTRTVNNRTGRVNILTWQGHDDALLRYT